MTTINVRMKNPFNLKPRGIQIRMGITTAASSSSSTIIISTIFRQSKRLVNKAPTILAEEAVVESLVANMIANAAVLQAIALREAGKWLLQLIELLNFG